MSDVQRTRTTAVWTKGVRLDRNDMAVVIALMSRLGLTLSEVLRAGLRALAREHRVTVTEVHKVEVEQTVKY